jgi:isopenicillin N synthase-like dioxygenase
MSSLPVLDYGLLVSNDPLSRASFIESLRGALADFGFFYISNTGLDRQTFFDAVFAASKGFFALPLDEKMKISNIHRYDDDYCVSSNAPTRRTQDTS